MKKLLFVALLSLSTYVHAEEESIVVRTVDKIMSVGNFNGEELNCLSHPGCGKAVLTSVRMQVASRIAILGLENKARRNACIDVIQGMYQLEEDVEVKKAMAKLVALLANSST